MNNLKLNEIDLKELVHEQFNRSNITEASTYNYVNTFNHILRDFRLQPLSLDLIAQLRAQAETLTSKANKSIHLYYIDFLEDYLMDRPSKPASDIKVKCQYCGGIASLHSSKQLYNGVDRGLVYLCENYNDGCDAYVSTHKGDNLPLGTLANTETRLARQKAHRKIDVLWQEYGFARVDVYKQLANYLGIKPNSCHIGKFNKSQCESAISFTRQIIGG